MDNKKKDNNKASSGGGRSPVSGASGANGGSGGSQSGGGGGSGQKRWGDTTSKRGEAMRVFVGNIDSKNTYTTDLEEKFNKYGRIDGIDILGNGFAFVQYATVAEAKNAVEKENGTLMKGRKIEVKLFDKSGHPTKSKFARQERSRSPIGRRGQYGGPRDSGYNRGMSGMGPGPGYGEGPPPFDGPGYGPGPGYQQGPNYPQVGPPGPGMGLGPEGPGYDPALRGAPMPGVQGAPGGVQRGNDVEIVVFDKDQWAFGERLEARIRAETPVKTVDMLFLHSPSLLSMTLNDLYTRRTVYAVIVTPESETRQIVTVHSFHNGQELPNMNINEAIAFINRDYRAYVATGVAAPFNSIEPKPYGMGNEVNAPFGGTNFGRPLDVDSRQGPGQPPAIGNSFSDYSSRPAANGNASSYSTTAPLGGGLNASSAEKRIPEDIAYLLRTVLNEGGPQFLSLTQLDSIIDYFQRERDRLTSQASRYSSGPLAANAAQALDAAAQQVSGSSDQPRSNLLDNPHVKAALNSLLQIGAITSGQRASAPSGVPGGPPAKEEAPSYLSTNSQPSNFPAGGMNRYASEPANKGGGTRWSNY